MSGLVAVQFLLVSIVPWLVKVQFHQVCLLPQLEERLSSNSDDVILPAHGVTVATGAVGGWDPTPRLRIRNGKLEQMWQAWTQIAELEQEVRLDYSWSVTRKYLCDGMTEWRAVEEV